MKLFRQFTPRARRAGMTLIELLMATGIGAVVATGALSLTAFGARSMVAMGNYTELDRHSQNALDTLTRDIRQANGLDTFADHQIRLRYPDGSSCTYTYNAEQRTLSRNLNGQSKVLLEQCDSLQFSVSQRNHTNEFAFAPATTLNTVKLIDVTWKCSREIRGEKLNTESIQTAKIVLRN
jgi:prepilin-type N-terminal cleavage/methylation domain-containing protein